MKAFQSKNISSYIREQDSKCASICRALKKEIAAALPQAEAKLYHGSPVWFIGENAVVGFTVTASGKVNLLFWNGQALDINELTPVGKFVAAQIQYESKAEIEPKKLGRWLKLAGKNIWDFASYRKTKLKAKRTK
jgi:hypothetical protein